jgi:uroporphyrinogen-III synthase
VKPHARPSVVIVTQDDAAGATLAAHLAAAGVEVWSVPVVASEALDDLSAVDSALARLPEIDWVAFTSVRAAHIVSARPAWLDWPWPTATRPRIGVVGPATREAVRAGGAPVALCPETPGASELAKAIVAADGGSLEGRTVLWPRSAIARPDLRDGLLAARARVLDPVAYTTRAVVPENMAEAAAAIEAGRVAAVAFLAPSSAEAFAAALGVSSLSLLRNRTVVASVGPTTTAALVRLGAPPTVEAPERTSGSLAAVLLSWFASIKGGTP